MQTVAEEPLSSGMEVKREGERDRGRIESVEETKSMIV